MTDSLSRERVEIALKLAVIWIKRQPLDGDNDPNVSAMLRRFRELDENPRALDEETSDRVR